MEAELREADEKPEVTSLLEQAQAAYENDDSRMVAELCRKVLDTDPQNAQAWFLLAKFGGWDSKLYTFDIDFAIDSAERALELVPTGNRHDAAAEIYTARKQQIGKILESEMMMPSYTAAKQLHATMAEWLRLLVEIPYLTVSLLEAEVALVNNLCLRSKMGIMPGERLVYTAYASLNGKETYGETFQKALSERLSREKASQDARVTLLIEEAGKRNADLKRLVSEGAVPAAELKALLEEESEKLACDIASVSDLSNRAIYDQQLKELERQLAALKPVKIFKRQDLTKQIAATKEKIAQVEAELAETIAPLRAFEDELSSLKDTLREG